MLDLVHASGLAGGGLTLYPKIGPFEVGVSGYDPGGIHAQESIH